MKAFLKSHTWAKKTLWTGLLILTPLWIFLALCGAVLVFILAAVYDFLDGLLE